MPRRPAAPATNGHVHPIYARLLRMLLQQSAIDSDSVLAAAGISWDKLLRDDRPLPLDTVVRLVRAALAATGKPWLGLDLGAHAPVSAHGALGYAAVTAPDLGQCLAVLARYSPVRNDTLAWSWRLGAEGAVIQAIECHDWGEARGFVIDTVVASLLRMVEAAVGQLPAGLQVDLPLPEPDWAAQYQRFAPVQLRFGQPALALRADGATLAWPCLGADPRAHANACRDCTLALEALGEQQLSHRVTTLLAEAPAGHYPRLAEVAAACQLSPRTLMRRLRADGSSFQALLDTARQDQALWLLQHSEHSVEDIAAQLGYADTSNFSRTVRRWFGQSARELRSGSGKPQPAAAR
jgi:AraC-like DNA-binding protein